MLSPVMYEDGSDPFKDGFRDGLNAYNEIMSVTSYTHQINDNWSISVGLSMSGVGVGGAVTYSNDGFTASVGGGTQFGMNHNTGQHGMGTTLSGGAGYYSERKDLGFGLGFSTYGGIQESQSHWHANIRFKDDFSIQISNDAFLNDKWGGGDKFRTGGMQFSYKNLSVGAGLYTTAPPIEQRNQAIGDDEDWSGSMHGKNIRPWANKYNKNAHTYSSGSRRYAGLYFGYQSGMSVSRIGIDAPWVQDAFQNGIHKYLTGSPFFNTTYGPNTRLFTNDLLYNPWSLY